MRRALLLLLPVVLAGLPVSGEAASPPPVLSRAGSAVTWSGTLTTPDPMGCGELVSKGCDVTALTVVAPKGAWITIGVDDQTAYLRVEEGGTYVAGNGGHLGTRTSPGGDRPSTTFQQVRPGRVVYQVGVSNQVASPALPMTYRAKAQLAGTGFDRLGDYFVGDSGLSRLQQQDEGELLRLSVRLVADPKDAAEVCKLVAPALVAAFRNIDVKVRLTLDVRTLRAQDTYPFEHVRRAYGGRRPAGVDVVHVVTDLFSGGFADCLGGVAYPEKGFSTGSLHYRTEGVVPGPTVTAASIAAHEIGHNLGGQHQMGNCVEAAPQQVEHPDSDGTPGPCTVMSPGAAQISEQFGTWERAVIRSYVRQYAKG